MGRVQTFDSDAVVRAARDVFWAHGYESASVPMLEDATGLRRSSLYHAFGSKRGLFDAAVDSYLAEVIRPLLRVLAEAPGQTGLGAYLSALRASLTDARASVAANGCLLINAAAAPIGRDPGVVRVLADYRAELRAAVGVGVDRARPDLGADARASLADTLTGLVVAALVLVRIDADGAVRLLDDAAALARR